MASPLLVGSVHKMSVLVKKEPAQGNRGLVALGLLLFAWEPPCKD